MTLTDSSPVKDVRNYNPSTCVRSFKNKRRRSVHPDFDSRPHRRHSLIRSSKRPRHTTNKALSFYNSCISVVREWASLPKDVINLIVDKLFDPIDHVRLRGVCSPWRSVLKEYKYTAKNWRNALPMLLIPMKQELYCVTDGKTYRKPQLPVPYNKRWSGSTHGWLVKVDESRDQFCVITLMNPFQNVAVIRLPPLKIMPWRNKRHFVSKVVLSADPTLTPDNYVVVAIYNFDFRLAFIKAGQNNWSFIKTPSMIYDVIFYRSKIYAVCNWGSILSFDVNSSNDPSQPPEVVNHPSFNHPFSGNADMDYLVESTKGELFHVRRLFKQKEGLYRHLWVESFSVFKLDFNEIDGSVAQQVEVKSIGDDALFLGDNHSFSLSASSVHKCQPNSIYYTDVPLPRFSCPSARKCPGIFNLADQTTQDFNLDFGKSIQAALWIVSPYNGLC